MNVDNKLFKRYYKNYIDGVSIENIEFKKFSYSELQEFLRSNYYDDELKRPVYWRPNGFVSPFGLQYLDFTSYSDDLSYLLGIVDNSSGKKTIVFCMEYDNNYAPFEEDGKRVGYIVTVETNCFFRNKGILGQGLNQMKELFCDVDVLVSSPESLMGEKISIIARISALFDGKPLVMSEEEYFNSLMKRHKW